MPTPEQDRPDPRASRVRGLPPEEKRAHRIAELENITNELLKEFDERGIGQSDLLQGDVYWIPGGNRIDGSIGGALSLALAMQGATVYVTHKHDDDNLRMQAEILQKKVQELGGKIIVSVGDITDPEARAQTLATIERDHGYLNGLFFQPAGGIAGTDAEADALNVQAPTDTVIDAKPLLKKGREKKGRAVAGDMPSHYSEFDGIIDPPVDMYARTARTKRGGQTGLDKITDELAEDGITRFSITAHAVEDTNAVALMFRRKPVEEVDALRKTAEVNGEIRFPRRADIVAAALKIITIGVPPGHTEYVGVKQIGREKIGEALPMYGPTKLLPDEVFFFGDETIARMHLDPERAQSPLKNDEIEPGFPYNNARFRTTLEHVNGHFVKDFGLELFRGVDQVAAAIKGARKNMQPFGVVNPLLESLEGISFQHPIPPGVEVTVNYEDVTVKTSLSDITRPDFAAHTLATGARTAKVQLESVGTTLMTIEQGRMVNALSFIDAEGHHDRLTQGIELAAQTLGIAALQKAGVSAADQLPLFLGIGRVELKPIIGKLSDNLEVKVVLREGKKKGVFEGDAILYDDGRQFATITELSGRMARADMMRDKINESMKTLLQLQGKQ